MRVERDAPLRYVNCVGMGMQTLFIGLVYHGVKPFVSFSHPNGLTSMLDGPEVQMGSSRRLMRN